MFSLLTGALALALAPALTEPAPPHPAEYALEWEAPPECPGAESVRARITALTAGASGGDGVVTIEGSIDRSERGYALTLSTEYAGASEVREFDDASCEALADSVALVAAASLDPGVVESRPPVFVPPALSPIPLAQPAQEPDAADDPSLDVEPPVSTPSPTPRVPAEEMSRGALPSGWSLRLAPLVEWGALPGVAGGVRLESGPQWRRASLEGFGQWIGPRESPPLAGARALVRLAAGGLRGCLRQPLLTVVISACGQFEAGGLGVRSRGVDPPRRLRFVWLAPGLRVGAERRWGRWGVFGAAEAAVPLDRARVLYGSQTTFESSFVSVRALAGISLFFATDLN